MSLSFGIVYIVRFDNMRSMYRASRWAEVQYVPIRHQLILTHCSCIESSENRDGHILECLGPARTTRSLARVVGARLRRCDYVLRLAHRRW